MKPFKLLALTVSLLFAAQVVADDVETESISVFVAGEAGHPPAPMHWIDSRLSGIDIHGMQVGETQSIVDDNGRSVMITREENGFRFDVDGRSIEIPEMPRFAGYASMQADPNMTADFDVEIVGGDFAMPLHEGNTVTIISGEPLDASVQESIK
ncbi:MAG: hypothetical protein R3192_17145, partial [Woeseiaceae bacterium]|nr:hypothetical protein [Woeseiaceae bacterium]